MKRMSATRNIFLIPNCFCHLMVVRMMAMMTMMWCDLCGDWKEGKMGRTEKSIEFEIWDGIEWFMFYYYQSQQIYIPAQLRVSSVVITFIIDYLSPSHVPRRRWIGGCELKSLRRQQHKNDLLIYTHITSIIVGAKHFTYNKSHPPRHHHKNASFWLDLAWLGLSWSGRVWSGHKKEQSRNNNISCISVSQSKETFFKVWIDTNTTYFWLP